MKLDYVVSREGAGYVASGYNSVEVVVFTNVLCVNGLMKLVV